MASRSGIFIMNKKLQLLTLLENHSRKLKELRDLRLHHVLLLLGMLLVTSSMPVSTMDTLEFTISFWKMLRPMNDYVWKNIYT
jgi:hypothetical protein